MINLNITLQASTEDLIWHLTKELDHEELVEFVRDLDLAVLDVAFTQDVVEALQESLVDEGLPKHEIYSNHCDEECCL